MYDSETTGLDITQDKIVEHGAIRVRDNEIVEELRILVNQNMMVPEGASRIHGITTEICTKEGKDPKESAGKVLGFMGDDVVIGMNNIPYDYPMLEMEVNRYSLPRPKIDRWFDVGMWHKGLCLGNQYNEKELFYLYANRIKNIRARIKYNLDHLVKTYGVENLRDDGVHGAIKDLRMNHHVFQKMKEKYCV